MITGLLRKYLKEHYALMSIAYHMGYAHTHALMQTTRFLLTYSLDLSDISEFEDYMDTSSNEGIPALEDTLYWKRLQFDLNFY